MANATGVCYKRDQKGWPNVAKGRGEGAGERASATRTRT